MSNSKIIERVQKLLEVTEEAGATPGEAASAAAMAAKLMQKYQVSVSRKKFIEAANVVGYQFRTDIRQTWRSLDEYKITSLLAENGLCELTGCTYFSMTGKVNKGGIIYGLQEDIDLFMELLEKIGAHVVSSMKRDCTGVKSMEPRKLRRSYVIGYSMGFEEKVKEILARDEEVKFSDGTGLVVVKDQLVSQYLESNGIKGTKSSSLSYNENGAAMGRAAAESAPINKSIKG